jgi:hypothetical protein
MKCAIAGNRVPTQNLPAREQSCYSRKVVIESRTPYLGSRPSAFGSGASAGWLFPCDRSAAFGDVPRPPG